MTKTTKTKIIILGLDDAKRQDAFKKGFYVNTEDNMDYKQLVIDSGIEMSQRKLTVSTWGNISIRDHETGYIYITPSGMDYDTCTRDDILVYDKDGKLVEGCRKPSIEKNMHLWIHQARPDVGAVMHTHPIYSSIFGVLNWDVPAVTEEFAQIIGKKVKCAEYFLPGTDELARAVVKALGQSMAALLVNHGAVCVGRDIKHVLNVSTVLEKACQVYYMAKCIGEPKIIDDEDVEAMQLFVATQYGQPKENK